MFAYIQLLCFYLVGTDSSWILFATLTKVTTQRFPASSYDIGVISHSWRPDKKMGRFVFKWLVMDKRPIPLSRWRSIAVVINMILIDRWRLLFLDSPRIVRIIGRMSLVHLESSSNMFWLLMFLMMQLSIYVLVLSAVYDQVPAKSFSQINDGRIHNLQNRHLALDPMSPIQFVLQGSSQCCYVLNLFLHLNPQHQQQRGIRGTGTVFEKESINFKQNCFSDSGSDQLCRVKFKKQISRLFRI